MRDVPCNELVELVTDYLDGALLPDRMAEVDAGANAEALTPPADRPR